MAASARFDLKLDKQDKALLAEAATLMGTTMGRFCAFCRKRKSAGDN